MIYAKLLEIEAALINQAGPIGTETDVILRTNYGSLGLYFDGSNYQVI
jgi:hypothetical protein